MKQTVRETDISEAYTCTLVWLLSSDHTEMSQVADLDSSESIPLTVHWARPCHRNALQGLCIVLDFSLNALIG